MAANRVGRRVNKMCGSPSPSRGGGGRDPGQNLQRRQEEEMPEEVNIDELLDLKTDEERTLRLQGILGSCNKNTQVFISELLVKLQGLQKQEELHNNGIDLPQLHICPTRSGSADREVLH
uniref:Uncharacterized protein n=1 Tax=Monopterus albus TaxID=43700 RepID=A0A3Q3KEE3_MONAL|nr:protein phosphatase 1 regulatory subunit 14A-like [Monopterus albus]